MLVYLQQHHPAIIEVAFGRPSIFVETVMGDAAAEHLHIAKTISTQELNMRAIMFSGTVWILPQQLKHPCLRHKPAVRLCR